jgi:hypothetical protein
MASLKRYKTQITAAVTQVSPDSDKFKSIAAAVEKYGLTLKPQMDVLYLESCLVSAGNMAGINENDDIFTRDEAWAARHSPVMKPLNWQHTDKDIIGVMYSIQARDLDGKVLDFSSDTPPECDFDLYTEAVVWRLIHADRAKEIESRAKARDLFVSMEAWFDDYSYGMCDLKGGLNEVVGRDKSTAFLDDHLRVNRGSGSYEGKRIGRVLRSITFGGCGFVDRPANKRSFITDVRVGSEEPAVVAFSEEEQLSKLIELLSNKLYSSKEEVLMNAQANQSDKPLTKAEVAELLDERERLQTQAAEQSAVKARAEAAELKVGKLEQDVSSLNQTLEAKNAELQTLDQEFKSLETALNEFVKVQVEAGATSSTPAEISAIDAAKDGEAAFKAKLAWIGNSMAQLRSRATRADELEAELVLAAEIVREQQVRALFSEVLPEDHVTALVEKAKSLADEAFEDWMAEKELLLIDLAPKSDAAFPPAAEDKGKKKMPFPPKKGEKVKPTDEEACASSQFRTLLESRNVTEADLINHPGGADVSSGLSSSKLKSVLLRHKVAGSTAGDDLTKELENAQPEGDNVNLAGTSQAGEEGEGENPFAALAAIVTEKKDKPTKKSESSKEN